MKMFKCIMCQTLFEIPKGKSGLVCSLACKQARGRQRARSYNARNRKIRAMGPIKIDTDVPLPGAYVEGLQAKARASSFSRL